MFYAAGGFRYLIKAAELATDPEPIPPRQAPAKVYSPPKQPEPPKIDRVKLERIAQNVLSTYGVEFDTYYYVRNKSDIELMDIITRYNLED